MTHLRVEDRNATLIHPQDLHRYRVWADLYERDRVNLPSDQSGQREAYPRSRHIACLRIVARAQGPVRREGKRLTNGDPRYTAFTGEFKLATK